MPQNYTSIGDVCREDLFLICAGLVNPTCIADVQYDKKYFFSLCEMCKDKIKFYVSYGYYVVAVDYMEIIKPQL